MTVLEALCALATQLGHVDAIRLTPARMPDDEDDHLREPHNVLLVAAEHDGALAQVSTAVQRHLTPLLFRAVGHHIAMELAARRFVRGLRARAS